MSLAYVSLLTREDCVFRALTNYVTKTPKRKVNLAGLQELPTIREAILLNFQVERQGM